MTVDRVRDIRAWASVLVGACEDYAATPTPFGNLMIHGAMRNLAIVMDTALTEELSPSEKEAVQ